MGADLRLARSQAVVDLSLLGRIKAEFGTAEFIAELAALERNLKRKSALPGTLGMLFSSYRASPTFAELAPATRRGYSRMMDLLKPLDEMPLVELSAQFIAGLRDQIVERHGRRQANYVMAVVSVACEHGKEHGIVRENPVKGVKRVKRSRSAPIANRPWKDRRRSDVPRLEAHRRDAFGGSRIRYRHCATLARPEDASNGHPLLRNRGHVTAHARGDHKARPAGAQIANIIV